MSSWGLAWRRPSSIMDCPIFNQFALFFFVCLYTTNNSICIGRVKTLAKLEVYSNENPQLNLELNRIQFNSIMVVSDDLLTSENGLHEMHSAF